MKFNVGSKEIFLNLLNGLYVSEEGDSGEGKSYLFSVLKALSNLEDSFACKTLLINEIKSDEELKVIISKIENNFYSLMFFDRADSYMTIELASCLRTKQLNKDSVILLDLKDWGDYVYIYPDFYEINLNPRRIEVNGTSTFRGW